LTGQQNYTRWRRDFRVVAESKGVWNIITGKEKILPKPEREIYLPNKSKTYNTRASSSKTATGEEPTVDQTDQIMYTTRMTEYKFALKEYDRNEAKVRLASSLIAYWIDQSIRGKVQSFNDLQESWNWIEQQYKM
jgi:hypothetical protein